MIFTPHWSQQRSTSIGTKILLPVGASFILFTIALALLIGVTSLNNLTNVKLAELERMSRILANNVTERVDSASVIAQSMEQSERITREIIQLSTYGPYYADPKDYFDPFSIATTPQPLEDASQVFELQATLNLLTQMQVSLQTNDLDSIGLYLLSPFDLLPNSKPALALWLDRDRIITAQFPEKGDLNQVSFYQIATSDFRSPHADYFDISSVYSIPATDFYLDLNFTPLSASTDLQFLEQEFSETVATNHIWYDQDIPVLRTVYPVEINLPHPETWDETPVKAAVLVIEQRLDKSTMEEFRNRLGLDVGFIHDDKLLITSLTNDDQSVIDMSSRVIEIDAKDYHFAREAIGPDASGLSALVLSPRSEVQSLISALQRQIMIIAALIVTVGSIIVYFSIQALVSHPLKTLIESTQGIERGDFNSRVLVRRTDELGQLANAFNTMAARIEELIGSLEERVSARTRDLRAAVEVSREITTVLELDDLLPEVVKLTANTYQLYSVAILLPDGREDVLRLSASINGNGLPFSNQDDFRIPYKTHHSIIAEAARTRLSIVVNDVSQYDRYLFINELAETKSELAIPMMLGTKFLGVFDVQSRYKDNFGEEEIAALEILAKQTGIAVRNAQLFEELRHARELAEQANQAKSAFLASVSHELRTPLNSIINLTEFVRHEMKGPVTPEQFETLGDVIAASEHLLNLINLVLDMSKIESGSLMLYIEDNVDLNALLETAISTARSLIKDKPIVVKDEVQKNLPKIRADEQRVLQILLNIVSNACRFTESGEIRFIAKQDGEDVLIAIRDTGPGIRAEDADKVFTAFKQTETGQKTGGGTGLGMPISRALVEEHGGQLWFEGKMSVGTTFYVLLPICSPQLEVIE